MVRLMQSLILTPNPAPKFAPLASRWAWHVMETGGLYMAQRGWYLLKALFCIFLYLCFISTSGACSILSVEKSAEEERAHFAELEYIFLATVTETRLTALSSTEWGSNTKVIETKYEIKETINGLLPSPSIVNVLLMSIGDCGSYMPVIAGYDYIILKRKGDVLSHAILYDALGTKFEGSEKMLIHYRALAKSLGQ